MADPDRRCRLILIAPEIGEPARLGAVVKDALRGGDVASVILPQYGLDDHTFQSCAEAAVAPIQAAGAAALIAGDTRVAGRVKADGLHVEGDAAALAEAIKQYAPKMIVGGGTAKTRHAALAIGELRPDYVFFGKLAGDIKPEPHSRNLDLAEWWASMVEVQCVVMGGSDPMSVLDAAKTGADFVALRVAVFGDEGQAAQIVSEVNAALDRDAPRFKG